jgi:hypothetical protein
MVFYQPRPSEYKALQTAIDEMATISTQIQSYDRMAQYPPCLAFECTDEGEMTAIMLSLGRADYEFALNLASLLRTEDRTQSILVIFPGIPPWEQFGDLVPWPREAL